MNSEKDRKAFEEWYEKHHNGRQISCDYAREDNFYSVGYANAVWVGWQASVNREGYKLVLEDEWLDQVSYIDHLLNLRSDAINKLTSGKYKLVPVDPDSKIQHNIALAIMNPAGTVHDVYKAAIGV